MLSVTNCKRGSDRRFVGWRIAAATLLLGAVPLRIAQAADCGPPSPGAPIFLTADCVDPHYTQPFIDLDEQRTTPVPHRYVHGGFTGTDTKFSLYFPPAAQYQ